MKLFKESKNKKEKTLALFYEQICYSAYGMIDYDIEDNTTYIKSLKYNKKEKTFYINFKVVFYNEEKFQEFKSSVHHAYDFLNRMFVGCQFKAQLNVSGKLIREGNNKDDDLLEIKEYFHVNLTTQNFENEKYQIKEERNLI